MEFQQDKNLRGVAMYDTKILIVDDEKENVRYIQTVLEENGFKNISAAYDGEEGFLKVKEIKPGLILLDLRMPKKSGIWLFNELKKSEEHKDIPVVILTGEGGFLRHLAELREFHETKGGVGDLSTEEVLNRFIYSRPDAFLEKPVDPEILIQVVRRILITLDEVKKDLSKKVYLIKDRMLARNVEYKGHLFALEPGLLSNLAINLGLMAAGVDLPQELFFSSSDGKIVPFTKEEALSFSRAVRDYMVKIDKVAVDHLTAIQGLSDMELAQAYDVQRNWPSSRLGGLT
jgi:CheY-like chemotaxis protein